MAASDVLVADRGAVRTLTIDRPAQRNALRTASFDQLRHELSAASLDRSVRCVVLTGSGDAFSAGLDLVDFTTAAPPADGERHGFVPCIEEIERFPKPLLAAVNGLAVGFGATVLAHCDLVVAADTARFRFPFVQLGLAPEAGASVLLPTRVGDQAAAHLLLTGSWIDAAAAHRIGLVWRVVAPDDLPAAIEEVADQIAAQALESLVATKKLLLAGRIDGVRAARARELESYARLLQGDAFKAAVTAFRQRAPHAPDR